jgi:hypothetical protein
VRDYIYNTNMVKAEGLRSALFLRRIVQFWYRRKGEAEGTAKWPISYLHLINVAMSEATLKKLLTKQRNIIEEIKQKTNYYSTRSLLDRYDNTKPPPVSETPSKVRTNYCLMSLGSKYSNAGFLEPITTTSSRIRPPSTVLTQHAQTS